MKLFAIAFVCVALLSTFTASTAFADGKGAQTTTEVDHGFSDTFTDIVPCELQGDALYSIRVTDHVDIFHETARPNGTFSVTFTSTGKFVATPVDNASLPTYTGSFTFWFGANTNHTEEGFFNGTGTGTIRGKASDGSRFVTHFVSHGLFFFDEEAEEDVLIEGFEKEICKP